MKDPRTGNLVNVVLGEDGTHRIIPLGVKPDIQLTDLGGNYQAIDKNETRGGQSFAKTPTFADRNSAYSNQIAAGNQNLSERRFKLDEQRFAYDQQKPEIKEINGQFVAVYPNGGGAGGGGPRMTPIAGGENLPGDVKLTEAQGNATQFGIRMGDYPHAARP
ncbi:hypothetical protein HK414_13025 [Ramlibacter terrae]|uniref:Uncharacterized protein n=1 Tax=Ramlibacter terrae TaxID=2732511 RepID=A0ABX6P4R7_9BURK|nr:hypothetical protein HK414_13025 [Ramlibacter terrae]